MLFSHGAALLSMKGIRLSSLCLLMHLLQDEITMILVLENRDLQDSIKPQKVEFHSLNFNSTLHWQPGRARVARDTVYFVQYKVYGQSTWQNKDDCWGIQNHVCDLTNETSDIQEPYYGRVKAASAGVYSDWSLSCRFTPWRETMIGPPTVTVIHSNKSITLKLQAPRSPYKRKRGSKIPMTNYYDLLYQVFIINNLLDEVSHQLKVEMTLEVKSYHFTKGRYSPKREKTGVGMKIAIPYDNISQSSYTISANFAPVIGIMAEGASHQRSSCKSSSVVYVRNTYLDTF